VRIWWAYGIRYGIMTWRQISIEQWVGFERKKHSLDC